LAIKLSFVIFEGVGNGLLLNLKMWLKSKVNFLNLNLEKLISQYGPAPRRGDMFVRTLGRL
jgi:hypothetical protein